MAVIRVETSEAAQLGEGPAWDSRRAAILWVDIKRDRAFSLTPTTGAFRAWDVSGSPSAILPAVDGRYLLPTRRGLICLDPETGHTELAIELTSVRDGYRTNEAKCDPDGNAWVSVMDDQERAADGFLVSIDDRGASQPRVTGVGIPNTLAWDTERQRFYFGDSATGEISVFDCPQGCVALDSRRTFVAPDAAPGVPDGSALDQNGYLWNARWGGGCVARFAPDGSVDRLISLPATNPTSCAFGGEKLDRLYVTTAAASGSEFLAGDGQLLSFAVDVKGASIAEFGSARHPAEPSRRTVSGP